MRHAILILLATTATPVFAQVDPLAPVPVTEPLPPIVEPETPVRPAARSLLLRRT